MNKKQQAFLDAYIANGFNQREACRTAGYSTQSGYWLVHRPEIARRVREEYEKLGITKDEVMRSIARLLRSNIADAIELTQDKDGNEIAIVDIKKAVESGLIADVTELKMKRGGLVEMKMADKVRVLNLAMKALGMGEGEVSEAEDEWWSAGDNG